MKSAVRGAGQVIATVWPALGLALLLPVAAVVAARLVLGGAGCAVSATACPTDPLRGDYRDAALLVFSAATGVPVAWEPTPAPFTIVVEFSLFTGMPVEPWLAAAVLLPALPGLLLAYSVARRARHTEARWYRLLSPALIGYGLGLTGVAALLSALPDNDGLVIHSAPAVLVALSGTVWAGAAATVALAILGTVSRGPAVRA